MSYFETLKEDRFWKFLVSLEELKERKELILFCSSLSIDEETLETYIAFLKEFKLTVLKDTHYIYPLKEPCRIKADFSLAEWLALQNRVAQVQDESYCQQVINHKFEMIERASAQFSLYKKPQEVVAENKSFEHLAKKLDYDIIQRKAIRVSFYTQKECDIFPHRLVFLDGVLCVIGECLADKMLVYFGVEDIRETVRLETVYEPNLSQIEVNEFICHLRLINGKEERLVLKIYSQDQADLLPLHHFLGNPFVTSSADGDMIWAATIEICDDIFHWLYNMRDRVEVLDPGHIRKEFAHYCELKKENSGMKKVS